MIQTVDPKLTPSAKKEESLANPFAYVITCLQFADSIWYVVGKGKALQIHRIMQKCVSFMASYFETFPLRPIYLKDQTMLTFPFLYLKVLSKGAYSNSRHATKVMLKNHLSSKIVN